MSCSTAAFPTDRVCISVGETATPDLVRRAAQSCGLIEFRLDLIRQPFTDLLSTLPAGFPFMVTCRSQKNLSTEERQRRLLEGLARGARWLDVDLDDPDTFQQKLATEARKHGCNVLLSLHDYQGLPTPALLHTLMDQATTLHAHAIKVACIIRDREDLTHFFECLPPSAQMLPVGMGAYGLQARVEALRGRAGFTYACLDAQQATAPGQPSVADLQKAWRS